MYVLTLSNDWAHGHAVARSLVCWWSPLLCVSLYLNVSPEIYGVILFSDIFGYSECNDWIYGNERGSLLKLAEICNWKLLAVHYNSDNIQQRTFFFCFGCRYFGVVLVLGRFFILIFIFNLLLILILIHLIQCEICKKTKKPCKQRTHTHTHKHLYTDISLNEPTKYGIRLFKSLSLSSFIILNMIAVWPTTHWIQIYLTKTLHFICKMICTSTCFTQYFSILYFHHFTENLLMDGII